MHDKIVERLGYDDSPIDLETSVEETASRENPWDKVIINSPYSELTKKDVFRYYSDKSVKDTLLNQIKDKPVMLRQSLSPEQVILKRKDIQISDASENSKDKSDYQYYIERRFSEFNRSFGEREKNVVIDLDPGDDVSFKDVTEVASRISTLVEQQSYVNDTTFQFSGNRGVYVWVELREEMPINDIRGKLTSLFSRVNSLAGVELTTGERNSSKQIRVDLSSLKNTGLIKAEGSLDHRTGLVATEIPKTKIKDFSPEQATIQNVLGYDPKGAYSFKYEEFI